MDDFESDGVSVIPSDGVREGVIDNDVDNVSEVDKLGVDDREADNSSVNVGVKLMDIERDAVVVVDSENLLMVCV